MNSSIVTFDCCAYPVINKILTNASENRFISYTYLNVIVLYIYDFSIKFENVAYDEGKR